ncbi:MAG TPA: tetratricopeptide repeat protein [Pseudomonadales bacterium]|nr:tetratricopeptide repeat protein [Pseudomonadales bacterium]
MIRIFVALLCLLWLGSAVATCNDDADRARREGRIEASIQILQGCLSENLGKVARSYLLLGIANYEKHDQVAAIENYTRAIATVPNYPSAFTNRGLSKAVSHDFKGAIADLDQALALDPKNLHARYFRGFTWTLEKKHANAVDDYSAALELATTKADRKLILFRRGLEYAALDNKDDALADFTAAIGIDPSYARAYFARATLLENRGDKDGALADYSRVIELDPANAEARYRRGSIYKSERKDRLAVADYNQAVKLNPHMLKARFGRSFIFLLPILPVLFVLALG